MQGPEPNWDALIRDCLEHPRDEPTLTRFFQALLPYLSAALLATYSRDHETVQDALQSAFLKYIDIFRKGGKSSPPTLGYFVVVAKNCLIDELRRRKGQIPIDEVAESELPAFTPPDLVDRADRMLLLQSGMMRLDSRCQFILESYYIEEMDSVQLAHSLGIASESVHMTIKRCRDRLRTVLTELQIAAIPIPAKPR